MATTLDEATIAREANRRIRRSNNITGWAFAGPSVIIVLGLSFIPMIWAAYLSLTDSNLVSPGHFIGFANYTALAKDPLLRQAFTNTLLLAVMYLPIGLAAGLGVAILLNRRSGSSASTAPASWCRSWPRRRPRASFSGSSSIPTSGS